MIGICARSQNNVIGIDGHLPWKCKGDLSFFKKMTMDKTIVVGRKTFQGLPPLPSREILVISNLDWLGDNYLSSEEFERILGESEHTEKFVLCGGAATYKSFINHCGVFYLTTIKSNYEGDTMFDNRWMEDFDMAEIVEETDEYVIEKYVKKINFGKSTGKRYKVGR